MVAIPHKKHTGNNTLTRSLLECNCLEVLWIHLAESRLLETYMTDNSSHRKYLPINI